MSEMSRPEPQQRLFRDILPGTLQQTVVSLVERYTAE